MNGINTNYQIRFAALIPKAQYSGKPKLSENEIKLIKAYKDRIRVIDKDIYEVEAELRNPDNDGSIVIYLQRRLSLLNKEKKDTNSIIESVREGNARDYTELIMPTKDECNPNLAYLDNKFNDAFVSQSDIIMNRM